MGRIAIFGGTFNPVHNGHLHLCRACMESFHFDKLLLIPTAIPPHKEAHALVCGEDRLQMLKIAAAGNEKIEICDIELARFSNGQAENMRKSYTVDTINDLKSLFQEDEFYLIIGSDMLLSFHEWHRYKEILSAAIVIAGAREADEYNMLLEYKESLGKLASRVEILPFEALPLSSTDIRAAIARGEDVSAFLPSGVSDYIKAHGLYSVCNAKPNQI